MLSLHSLLSVCPCRQFSTACRPPVLSVSPCRALVDERLTVQVENLPPGLPVTIRSLLRSEDDHYWEAYGYYVSNHRGAVSGRFCSVTPLHFGEERIKRHLVPLCSYR